MRSLLLLVPSIVMFMVAQVTWPRVAGTNGDMNLYYRCAQKISSGAVPYRDFKIEYPPGALIACLVPRVLSGGQDWGVAAYRALFLFTNAIYLAIITGCAALVARRFGANVVKVIAWLTLFAGLTAPLTAWRYDIFPAMLTAVGLTALLFNRPFTSGAFLALGISAKLYPIVLVPVIGLYLLAGRNWKAVFRLGAGCTVVLLLTTLPFYLLGSEGLLAFLKYHQQRGIQVESLSGGIFMLASILEHGRAPLGLSYGAWHIHSPLANALAPLHTFFFLSLYLIVLWQAYGRFRETSSSRVPNAAGDRELIAFCAAALFAFLLTNKVLSPQYLAWLFPFAVFLPTGRAVLFAATCAATTVITPYFYNALLGCELWAVILLNVRNGMLLVLFLWFLVPETASKIALKPSTVPVG